MKIRNGFVSNSSSSSFVILLPDNFDIETIDFVKEVEKDNYSDAESESVKEAMKSLLKNKYLYNVEYYEEIGVIENILKDYTIGEFETGPDSGAIIIADKKKVKKILGI